MYNEINYFNDPQQQFPVGYCSYCGDEIYSGDDIYTGAEGAFHSECIGHFLRDKIDEDDAFAQMVANELGYDRTTS